MRPRRQLARSGRPAGNSSATIPLLCRRPVRASGQTYTQVMADSDPPEVSAVPLPSAAEVPEIPAPSAAEVPEIPGPSVAEGPEALAPSASQPPTAPLPEFLNPESTHYQPWAEKQIFNATKDKRPLEAFMADLEERLKAYPELPQAHWDPSRQEQLLARFAVAVPSRSKRRRRHRSGSSAPATPATGARPSGRSSHPGRGPRRSPGEQPSATIPPAVASRPPSQATGEHRRRRRRRPRGASSGGTPPPVA